MTDNQIIKALECCGDPYSICVECPIKADRRCKEYLANYALDLINRQQAEIERLKGYNENLQAANTALSNEIIEIKAESVREFAERLKRKFDVVYSIKNLQDNIDNLVKEMVGEENE